MPEGVALLLKRWMTLQVKEKIGEESISSRTPPRTTSSSRIFENGLGVCGGRGGGLCGVGGNSFLHSLDDRDDFENLFAEEVLSRGSVSIPVHFMDPADRDRPHTAPHTALIHSPRPRQMFGLSHRTYRHHERHGHGHYTAHRC